ncbi:proprotein convertase subtilisin/kexin type 4-like [Mytilus edulis]|uniref:proprotein convertase subtilisin/kexin type 4-like n=1 Tax=Mytilus edulis TaxID=6550 RepID=UPI0039F0BDE0
MCSWIINSVLILFLHFNSFNTLESTKTIDEIVIELSDGDNTGAVSERFPNLGFVDKLTIGERKFYKFKLRDSDGGHLPSTSRSDEKDTTIRALQTDSTESIYRTKDTTIRALQTDSTVSIYRTKDTTIRALQTDSTIGYVGPQIRRHFYKKTFDEGWEKQWHLNGEIYPSMNVHKAWEAGYTGSDVVIAIVDDGIQTNHPDLRNNVDTVNDYDYISSDSNPFPTFSSDSHGTHIAGLIAAERDNGECVVGVAYNASLVGIRLIGDIAVTDFEQAKALSHYNSDVDIYTCSWGPEELIDFGSMDFLTSLIIAHNAKKGRSGKGIIYTWSAGNGGPNDNCNADGFTNSIYTIGVTALGIGKEADYAEVCAASLATVYGGIADSYLMTTSTLSRCTDDGIEGTSYSAPIVAGIIALALQANPDLTWRDVQHLIVYSSSRTNLTDTYDRWQTNGAGKEGMFNDI